MCYKAHAIHSNKQTSHIIWRSLLIDASKWPVQTKRQTFRYVFTVIDTLYIQPLLQHMLYTLNNALHIVQQKQGNSSTTYAVIVRNRQIKVIGSLSYHTKVKGRTHASHSRVENHCIRHSLPEPET